MNTHDFTLKNIIFGAFGIAAPIAGVMINLLANVEIGLRIVSLLVGTLVGCLTAWNLALKIRNQKIYGNLQAEKLAKLRKECGLKPKGETTQ